MRSVAGVVVLLVPTVLFVAGCGASRGDGRWDLTPGGEATLVSADGADIVLESLVATQKTRSSRQARPPASTKVETTTVASGTAVEVLAIDGDDARIRIKVGPKVGLTTWVECAKLEPVTR
jgi:hypothetical protein